MNAAEGKDAIEGLGFEVAPEGARRRKFPLSAGDLVSSLKSVVVLTLLAHPDME